MKREAKTQKTLPPEKPKKPLSAAQKPAEKPVLKSSRSIVRVETKIQKTAARNSSKSEKILEKVVVSIKPATAKPKKQQPVAAIAASTLKKKPQPTAVKITPETKTARLKKALEIPASKTAPAPKSRAVGKIKSKIEAPAKPEKPKAPKKAATETKIQKKNAVQTEKPKISKKPAIEPKLQKRAAVSLEKPKTLKKAATVPAPPPGSPVKKAKTNSSPRTLMPIESEVKAPVAKPLKKKIKPISSAVLRGKSGRYDFEVFPLDAEFEKTPAIYVISKRVTDKQRRGHHKLICIGETDSIFDDIKKHKKDKCIKENKANVVCLLKEQDETNRLKIATDLRAAHMIVCQHK